MNGIKKRIRGRSIFTRMIAGMMAAVIIYLAFMLLFGAFERISLQAIISTHTDFVRHASTISAAMQLLVQAMGTQIYHISSAGKLRTAGEMTTFDRIYALREVGQYASSSPMLQSIYIFNEAQQRVYTTDELFFSAPYESFSDREALTLYQERGRATRNRLMQRTIVSPQLPKPRASYFFLMFETKPDGSLIPGAVMLNLDPAFFKNRMLSFPGENTLVLERDGRVVAAQSPDLVILGQALLPRVLEKASDAADGYIIDSDKEERLLCFYALMPASDWVTMKIIPYSQALPGLQRVRDAAALVIGMVMLALLLSSAFAFVRIYRPLTRIRRRLTVDQAFSDSAESGGIKLDEKLDRILAASLHLKRAEALRDALNGQSFDPALLAQLPAALVLAQREADRGFEERVLAADENALCISLGADSLVLLPLGKGPGARALCEHLVESFGCRCYYSLDIKAWPDLSACAQDLYELRSLRLLYPGQRIFCQTLLQSHRGAQAYPADEASAMISALKAGDWQNIRQNFFDFIRGLRNQSYQDLAFALKRLLAQLQAAGPGGSDTPLFACDAEEILSRAEDTGALLSALEPGLETVIAFHQERKRKKVSALAQQVIIRLEQGYTDPYLGVKQIANEMGMTPAYLRKQFFDAYRMPISEYLNRLRIDHAKALVKSTGLSVEAIARQIGFENHKYMFVVFKRIVGMTPREYVRSTAGQVEDP